MSTLETLQQAITDRCAHLVKESSLAYNELTVEVTRDHLVTLATLLRDTTDFAFDLLVDVFGVDYLHYGVAEWATESTTETGFSRGVNAETTTHFQRETTFPENTPRFAVVYHLLSIKHNQRIRLRVRLEENDLFLPSVVDIWPAANWFEREAFDLFGIVFTGHPDLRRILTDYGFVGHPFRKDFPLIGKVELRYDAEQKRVIYEPVSIQPRVLEPKVIRSDNRYLTGE